MLFSSCPPGLLYIFQITPRPALWLLPLLIGIRAAANNLPNYVWILAYFSALTAGAVRNRISQHFLEEAEIKRLGARRAPQVHSNWPGGADLIVKMLKSFSDGYVGDTWDEAAREYGPTFNLRVLWKDLILTTDPGNMKAMLATDFEKYEKGAKFRWYFESVLGTGVFNSDGDLWKFHRGITRPFFARDRVTDFDLFNRHADEVVAQMKARFAEGEAVDFQDVMSRFTLDSSTEFMFGSCVHSLAARLPYPHNSPRRRSGSQPHSSDKFGAALGRAQHRIALRSRLADLWPLAEFWKDKTQDEMKVINDYVDPILRDALKKKAESEKNPLPGVDDDQPEILLDHLVGLTDDHALLRDEIVNVMIAGRDTTMAVSTFVVYCLAQDPGVLMKLREEILTKVGPTRAPTIQDIRECNYLKAVINETLRLYPPVPFNARNAKCSTTLPAPDGGKPYYIPAGVDVPYSVWLMHRRTDLWGPDAHEFDPDRFLDERLHKYLTPNPFIFLPFNAGPRICLGQQFAYNETSFMLVRLLQAFDSVTLDTEAQPPDARPPLTWQSTSGRQSKEKVWPKVHLTLHSHKGLWVRMGEAKYADVV